MSDETSNCPLENTSEPSGDGRSLATVARRLPTLQCNALRKIFDRHEFTPEEVASLGYRRLQQADGIGNKGLAAITDWLKVHGFELKPPEPTAVARPPLPKKMRRNIESALRLLRTHGYVVHQANEMESGSGVTVEGKRVHQRGQAMK